MAAHIVAVSMPRAIIFAATPVVERSFRNLVEDIYAHEIVFREHFFGKMRDDDTFLLGVDQKVITGVDALKTGFAMIYVIVALAVHVHG